MPSNIQRRTLDHVGNEVGADNVSRDAAGIEWTAPRKYDSVMFNGQRHVTRLTLRYKNASEVQDGTTDETFGLTSGFYPVNGETALDDQPEGREAVVAVNQTTGNAIPQSAITPDYANDRVTIASSEISTGDFVFMFPLLQEGSVQVEGINQFGQSEGVANRFGVNLAEWSDVNTNEDGREVRMSGAVKLARDETMRIDVDSPETIAWTDGAYESAFGEQYISTVSQKVDVEL